MFRRILLLLVAFAIIGGTTSEGGTFGGIWRPHGHGGHAVRHGDAASIAGDTKPMPCKGMTADCIKQMGCVTATALPAPFLTHASTVRYSAVDYWTPVIRLAGLIHEPEPLPPRTI